MPSAIGIGEPINQALFRTGVVLFTPFRLKKWLLFAIPAALMLVGVGMPPAVNVGFQFAMHGLRGVSLDDALKWYTEHTAAILIVMSALVIFVFFPLYLLCRWLNGRSYMVFYHNLVNNEFEMKQSWREFRELGNSLMKMIISWELILFNLWLGALIIASLFAIPDIRHLFEIGEYQATGWTAAAVIVFALEAIVLMIGTWLAASVVYLLAVPVMYIRRMKAREAMRVAWRELFLPHKGICLLYFLMNIVTGIVKGSVASLGLIVLGVVTLALACCMIYVPFLGNYPLGLAALPATTFESAFHLYFVSQFGEEYRVPWSEAARRGGFPVTLTSTAPDDAPQTQ